MRSAFALCLTIIFPLVSERASLRAEFLNCPNCDVQFTLTHADVVCVAKRIDRLLGRPDPVYFDAANCDQNTTKVMSPAQPNIVPPQPTASPTEKWLQLTKQQLQCLRTKLPELQSSKDDPVAVSLSASDCSGNKP
jgi:hypothetical protein